MTTALRLVEGSSMDKSKALDAALSQIERNFGKGSIMRLGKNDKSMDVETVSTGSLGLDIALGIGGLPLGRALEIADTLVRSGAVDVLVIDSVAALVPRAELEGEMGDSQPGLQARLMSQALRKLTASINRSNTMVIFINQIRVKVVKNKLAPPFKTVEFDIMYGEGVSKNGELIDLGVKAGVVEKSGAWFSYDSQRIGQGRENAKAFLKANPEIAAKIDTAIRQNAGLIAERILAGDERTENEDAAE